MIAVLSDTHGTDDPRLAGAAAEAVEAADVVIHAGDFTTVPVVEAFEAVSERLVAVHGNVDDDGVHDRLPAAESIEAGSARIVVVHGHDHSETALAMLGRQEGADLVISGHSHRPGVVEADEVTLLNPGSHAEPRGYTAAHGELVRDGDRFRGRLVDAEGDTLRSFEL